MSEVRVLIRRGIFSLVRHPLYTGHFVMFFPRLTHG
jgi:protein-S-isoprenylcysteine O-methyltransferase Ste14